MTRRLHIGFVAPSRGHVDAFWHVGTDAGYRDDGAPGPRPQYGGDYYGSFLLDPDGNSAEAVHHGSTVLRWRPVTGTTELPASDPSTTDPGYHAAFVLDPDGNNVEVVSHNRA